MYPFVRSGSLSIQLCTICPSLQRSTLEASLSSSTPTSVSLLKTLALQVADTNNPPLAGKECTAVFFGLHRQEILYNERYAKLVIGQIENEQQLVRRNEAGSISQVPYAEPMWLTPGFKRSPYFKESHYAVQKGQSVVPFWRGSPSC